MKRYRISLPLILLAMCAAVASAQVRQVNSGRALDSSLQVGSSGYNQTYNPQSALNSQMYVTGQVTGGKQFRDSTGYTAANELRLTLPSQEMSNFRRGSVGLDEVLQGQPYKTDIYWDRDRTILGLREAQAGLTVPGSQMPLVTNISPTLVNQLYKDSMVGYEPIVVRPVGQALTNLDSLKSSSASVPIVGSESAYEAPRIRTGTADLFNVPSTEERKKLLEELSMHGRRDTWVDLRTSAEADVEPLNADARRSAATDRSLEDVPEASERGVTRGGYVIPPEQRQAPQDAPAQPQQAYPGWSGQQETAPKIDQDVYFDLLQKMSELKRAEAAGADSAAAAQRSSAKVTLMPEGSPQDESLASPNFRASSQTPELPYNRVEMGDSGVVLHSLAGRGEDRFNQFMTEAETQLRAGHYYAAADQYRLAIRANPNNPLANLGMSIALVGAGEPLGAASHLQKAMQLYPPLMEVRLDLPRMVPTDVIVRQISIVETRLEGQEMGDASLLMVATFIQENLGNSRIARKLAAELKESAGDDLLLNAYADYILSEKNQSSEEPATQLRLPEN